MENYALQTLQYPTAVAADSANNANTLLAVFFQRNYKKLRPKLRSKTLRWILFVRYDVIPAWPCIMVAAILHTIILYIAILSPKLNPVKGADRIPFPFPQVWPR